MAMTKFWFLLSSSVLMLVTSNSADEGSLSNREFACEVTLQESQNVILIGKLIQETPLSSQGALLISGTVIEEIGDATAITQANPEATVIDCGNSYISPGFINPHEHLNHSGGTPDPKTSPIYQHRDEWRGQVGDKYALAFHSVSIASRNIWIELRHIFAGTTTIASSGGVSNLVKNAQNHKDTADYPIDYEIFPYGFISRFHDSQATSNGDLSQVRLSDEPHLRTKPYIAHVAEGIDQTATLEGIHFLQHVEQNPERRYSLVHGVGLDSTSISKLKSLDVTLIWSPRSNVALYNATANIPDVLEAEGRVALSTDWSFSGSYNILEEIQCADYIDDKIWGDRLRGQDYWYMITVNSAYALGIEEKTGRLVPGLAADLVVMRNDTDDFFQDLLKSGVNDVLLTIVDGNIQSGHTDALIESALTPNCRNVIDSHFFCFDWEVEGKSNELSLDRLLNENMDVENVVPLFNTESQATCLIDLEN